MNSSLKSLTLETTPPRDTRSFSDPAAAVDYLEELYFEACSFLTEKFSRVAAGAEPEARYRVPGKKHNPRFISQMIYLLSPVRP